MGMHSGRTGIIVCAALTAAWIATSLAAAALSGTATGPAVAGAQALLLLTLALVHGGLTLGGRGICTFLLIVGTVSFLLEASSIAYGFPFGFYVHFTPGPRLLEVPLLVPLGYVVFGWFAWCIALLIVGEDSGRFVTPVVAAFVLAGYDYAFDPVGATALHAYAYRTPSGLMGVPLVNFLGWLFTGWVGYQIFTLIGRRQRRAPGIVLTAIPVIIWCVMALGYTVQFAHAPSGMTTVGDRRFVIADVYETAVAISIMAMVFPALLAALKLRRG